MPQFRKIEPGDPAPWFHQASSGNRNYSFDTAAGRYIVLCFFGTCRDAAGAGMIEILKEHRSLFDDEKIAFFGVSIDPTDRDENRVAEQLPGIRHFWDFDYSVSKLYGALPVDAKAGETPLRRFWVVIDPTMRVRAVFNARPDGGDRHEVAGYLKGLPPVDRCAGFVVQAPVLVLPNVFEPDFCDMLIGLYDKDGGEESGFMRDVGGKTVQIVDFNHKRRSDFMLEDEALKTQVQRKIIKRIVPEIKKVHEFTVTRMERYLVACYESATSGHFRAHRDNTTKGTAHRRFAVSINLNDDFEGGEISFPEYGPRGFKMGKGGAVVFSCSLLHAVSAVRKGKRYAFLPFLYDDAAAALREKNNQFLDESVGAYKMS